MAIQLRNSVSSVLLAAWTVLVSSIPVPVRAAELRVNTHGSYRSMDIEGPIEAGDYDRFIHLVKENQAKLSGVQLYSPGGNLYEAMKIGRALRKLEISSQVPMKGKDGLPQCDDLLGSKPRKPENCTAASAAFFIHIGGVHRGGTYLVVHRPTFEANEFKELSQAEAKVAYDKLLLDAKAYMEEMALPLQIQDLVLNTPSTDAKVLEEATVRTYIWGDLPYREEWQRAKCGKLNAAELQRSKAIGARILQGYQLTDEEKGELDRLSPLRDQESKCSIALTEQSRSAAYQQFFGESPSDVVGHKFERWTQAPSYLGKTFESISEEERFEPGSTIASTITLEKKETATAPSVTVMDRPGKKGVVSWIEVSKEDPDDEFKKKLASFVTDAWGAPAIDGTALKWSAKIFRAKLSYETGGGHTAAILVIEPQEYVR